jgi:hypothetical protein
LSSIYILDINILSDLQLSNMSLIPKILFTLLTVSFVMHDFIYMWNV